MQNNLFQNIDIRVPRGSTQVHNDVEQSVLAEFRVALVKVGDEITLREEAFGQLVPSPPKHGKDHHRHGRFQRYGCVSPRIPQCSHYLQASVQQ